MSALVLVRHGQATPFEEISDRLSPTGEQQAIRLGEYWRERRIVFDEVYAGTMLRHTRTAELSGYPAFTSNSAFNEYDADAILKALPGYERPKDNRQLQKMFDAAMPKWIQGELEAPGLESWAAFRSRVLGGLRAILEAERPSRQVAVFTSAGPIGVAVQTALKAPEQVAIELNWRMRNCSLTEFVFSGRRVSLDVFNATPHLAGATFR